MVAKCGNKRKDLRNEESAQGRDPPHLPAAVDFRFSAQDANRSTPMAPPLPPEMPAAKDVPYAGTIGLNIDATDISRGSTASPRRSRSRSARAT
ncbi:hypothetical protein [Novosphingobium resinovorum]|uniref:hypothetical protein n=1 Tax=Novosphingobium resinovorum TaxID=158500 RepID=UPI003D2BFC07